MANGWFGEPWWSQGAADEAKARNELNAGGRELRDALEAFAQGYGKTSMVTAADLLTGLARIYCPGRLRRKYRR